jgi:hypothetical protein
MQSTGPGVEGCGGGSGGCALGAGGAELIECMRSAWQGAESMGKGGVGVGGELRVDMAVGMRLGTLVG